MGCGATSHSESTTTPPTELGDMQVSKISESVQKDTTQMPMTQETLQLASIDTSTKPSVSGTQQDAVDVSAQSKVLVNCPETISPAIDPELVPRLLTHDEREEAWRNANFYNASSGHKRPIALWILGPSSVGKSTLTAQVGPKFEIPLLDESVSGTVEGRTKLDAVLIDGEFIRDAHGVWQKWTKTSDWRSAYPALKSTINKEKDHLYTEATSQRKHLIIPQTVLNLQKGLDEVEGLMWQGYTNHVVAVVAPLEECQRRGMSRELTTGKRYKAKEYEQSILAIPPMITTSNGKYNIVQAIERNDSKTMDYHMLSSGPCCRHEDFINAPSSPFTEEELHTIIDDAIKIKEMSERSPSKSGLDSMVNVCRSAARFRRSFTSPCKPTHEVGSFPTPIAQLDASLMPRPFHEDERREAWTGANFYSASSNHDHPIALWILGPSSVGKKELTSQLATRFDIAAGKLPSKQEEDARKLLDAVVVDGECFRAAYGVWRLWMQSPERQFAYRALKSAIDKEKAAMCEEAITKRQNLVIPASLLNLKKGLTEVEELTRSGYVNHVVGVVASKEWCTERGQDSEIQKGKGYRAEDFEESIESIIPMIAACNGRYEIVRPARADPNLGDSSHRVLSFDCIANGTGSVTCTGDSKEGVSPNLVELQEIIKKTIAPTSQT